MHRFYIEDIDNAFLTGDDYTHATRVLRLRHGDEIYLFDGRAEYRALISSCDKSSMELQITEKLDFNSEPICKLTLYQALPKADKYEYVLQKGTELGISTFCFFTSARCVAKGTLNEDRMRRIIYESAKQSRRLSLPLLYTGLSFADLLSRLRSHTSTLVAWEEEKKLSLRTALKDLPHPIEDIAVIVGAEGGFSSEEANQMQSCGARTVTLGPRILRTETAGPALAAMILYEMGQME